MRTDAMTALTTDLAGIRLRNPVLLAAGTCGYLDEMADVLDLSRIGGIVTKSITAQPREGHDTWRILAAESGGGTCGGMLNAIGLANVGIEHFAQHIAPRAPAVPATIIGSISGFTVDQFVSVAAAMDDCEGLAGVELNVSCPNVHHGVAFGSDPKLLRDLIAAVRPVLSRLRLFVKLSPNAPDPPGIAAIARAAIEGHNQPAGPNSRPGADALCVANTMPAMAIDVHTRKPRLSNVTGGLSGPAIHPIAVRLVHDVYRGVAKATSTPIVGIGGVLTWEDAAEFILAGASAVQMGTALFVDPASPIKVVRGLERWVAAQHAASIADLVGAVALPS